jgi:hypothetical protein
MNHKDNRIVAVKPNTAFANYLPPRRRCGTSTQKLTRTMRQQRREQRGPVPDFARRLRHRGLGRTAEDSGFIARCAPGRHRGGASSEDAAVGVGVSVPVGVSQQLSLAHARRSIPCLHVEPDLAGGLGEARIAGVRDMSHMSGGSPMAF